MTTQIFTCEICGFDKFHTCKDNDHMFVSCANCGIRTDIDIKDSEYLKTNSDNV
jgi:transcription elongation factor Elf1